MEAHDEELIQTLAVDNYELRQAYDEHQRLNAMVDQLGVKTVLTFADEQQKKKLQKLKLIEKDKIMKILAEHRRAAAG